MFSLLPTSLLALLLSSPVLAGPTTPNDLFRPISLQAPKRTEEPVCCLRPLPPLEPPPSEDDLLPSFEDWKTKHLSDPKDQDGPPRPARTENLSAEANGSADPAHSSHHASDVPVVDTADGTLGDAPATAPPPFRVPIPTKDRFNYASLDCSARVHGAHKGAKSASSILSSKKDRYMLSPCSDAHRFVVVELCEDIRIDTVQLANYEFFSGVFKDFTVSVAKQYTDDPAHMTHAGTFRAKNVRGVQTFHPPSTLRDFYRFIRIDFRSHYGNEYYCPVSLLRVYGLTHLEEWQWETWEEESRARRSAEEASSLVDVSAEPPKPVHTPTSDTPHDSNETDAAAPSSDPADPLTNAGGSSREILESLQYNLSTPIPDPSPHTTMETTSLIKTVSDIHDSARSQSDTLYNTHVSLSTASSTPTPRSLTTRPLQPYLSTRNILRILLPPLAPQSLRMATLSSLSPLPCRPQPAHTNGGESIYRLIMNRLTALEANTTLYARYVEEQTAGMREVLRRLTEDIGRLEGIKAQAQLYQRSVVELEKQTRRLEKEQHDLLSKVENLTDEVLLEKRLGIAQLCLLLTVLVFMALTRGSRGEHAYRNNAVREWGRRTLSFSGGLVNRLRTRSSTPPRLTITGDPDTPQRPRRAHHLHLHPVARKASGTALTRPHTPISLRTPTSRHLAHHRFAAPTSPIRPGMQRSNSGSLSLGFGGVGPVPKSAKRWARSAHLHEVKASPHRSALELDDTATPVPSTSASASTSSSRNATPNSGERHGDAFDPTAEGQVLVVPAALSAFDAGTGTLSRSKGKLVARGLRRPAGPPPAEGDGEASDAWVDTDGDDGETEGEFVDSCVRCFRLP
ncbi:UNC-like C-terminal-domain-containing protein [Epithele typhae]|uniref:UNC-like C-terminal-domain-containing protein n=1 Tax=Epithele typhae TaxID=378194 RepID=UPI0020077E83|nr:UNC-like C-terminal-domain-containing protein [Epithele typhae]KAH9932750.1 UNC-like C-terminal-domain-containing protein [Epithele typhae]